MQSKKLALLVCLLLSVRLFAQTNFSYWPENPKPGDQITISYEPSGTIAGTMKPVEASFYILGYGEYSPKNLAADDITLKKEGKKYTGTFTVDQDARFIYFSFVSDKNFDNNFNNGYYIVLKDGEKPLRGAHMGEAYFYQFYGRNVGLEANQEKALEAMGNEIKYYPEDKYNYVSQYYRLMNSLKKSDVAQAIQTDIEKLMKNGLKTEADYSAVESLYSTAKLPEQAKMISAIKKDKFPDGKWRVNEFYSKYNAEKDPAKAAALLADALEKAKTNPDWKAVETNLDNLKLQPLYALIRAKDWTGFQKAAASTKVSDFGSIANLYNQAAWEMQKTSSELPLAEEFAKKATEWTKAEVTKPSGKKPVWATTKEWEKNRKFMYQQFADTYAMVLYRKGDNKNAYKYAKEIQKLSEGKDPDYNNTYALVAEKSLPAKQYKKELEVFIKEGKAGPEVKEVLRRAYVADKGKEEGFDQYIVALEKETYLRMIDELRKSMMNEASPSFALLDLNGSPVNIQDLRGKVVVVDFWATWCGPCKASFPGMQKMVNKYKEDPNVRFVFIDTWENVEDKKKNASDFIAANKYPFHVLMDMDNKVVEQFKVDGIPTKFVIDKNGIIRFKSVGYSGSDDKLVSELTAMIDMASQQTAGKTF